MVQSLPYFMDAPSFLRYQHVKEISIEIQHWYLFFFRSDVEFMNFKGEDRERHGTFDIVEQKTGTSLGVHKRMQVRKYYSHFFKM